MSKIAKKISYYRERSKRYKLTRKCDNKEPNHELFRAETAREWMDEVSMDLVYQTPPLPSRQMSNSNQLQMCCCCPSSMLFNYISEAVFTLFTSYWAHSSLSHGSLTSQWLNSFCWWQLWLLADLRLPAGHSMGGSWQWIGRCLWVSPDQAGQRSLWPGGLRCHVWPLVALHYRKLRGTRQTFF